MKKMIKTTLVVLGALLAFNSALAQERMTKKFRTLNTEIVIDAPAKKVWEAMVLDYGRIGNFSPYIFSSNYENGSLQGKVGAERKCYFSANEKRWAHETILAIDSENMRMTNIIKDAAKFPLDKENSQAVYYVKDNGNGTSTAGYKFQFRTIPAFMGGLAKGRFKKTLGGTLVGLKHYVETGEIVNASNKKYNEIKKDYTYTVVKNK